MYRAIIIATTLSCGCDLNSTPPSRADARIPVVDAAAPSDAPVAPPDARPAAPDASMPDASASDAAGPPCDLAAPWGAPVPIVELDTLDSERGLTLSPDELTMYFASNRTDPGTSINSLYQASRTARDQPFGAAAPLATMDIGTDNRHPALSPDQLSLYFNSSRGGNQDLYLSTRTGVAAPFEAAVPLDNLNSPVSDCCAEIAEDGQSLYLASPRTAGVSQIFRSVLGPGGFEAPTALLELGDYASFPAPSQDGLTIYFTRTTAADMDVWVAHRATTTVDFDAPVAVDELNVVGSDEAPEWLSPDGCRLYLSSDRDGAQWDLFVATRP